MQEGWRKSPLRLWLAVVGTATLVLGASYAMVHQSARLAADDAPLATVQDAKQKLSDDTAPSDIVPEEETDLRSDAGVFLIITDSSKKVLASSAVLDDEAPLPTADILKYAEENGSDHFTWEPKEGVRLATQVLKYEENGGGYIIAGQSLKSTEERLGRYSLIAVTAWIAIVVWTLIVLFSPSKNSVSSSTPKKSSTK